MNGRRALALAGGLAWWAAGARPAAGQVAPAQPARYLLTTEASDARALWVNPAGLARAIEASIGADLTADRFIQGPGTQLSQYGLSLAGRGVAAGWEHERLAERQSLNIYAVGIGLGDEKFSAGDDPTLVHGRGPRFGLGRGGAGLLRGRDPTLAGDAEHRLAAAARLHLLGHAGTRSAGEPAQRRPAGGW